MANSTESPMAVKVEEHSQCVILTYFHGDISSMVDAHFTRALGKICKAKAPAAKSKKIRKSVKMEEPDSSQWRAADSCSYSEVQVQPVAGRLQLSKEPHCSLTLSPVDDSPGVWHSLPARPVGGPNLPPIPYSLSPDGLGQTGQQYATSLLNLLHSDRAEMGPSMVSGTKPELLPTWTMPQGFRDSMDPAVSFEPGRRPNKKDLYWY